MGCRGVTLSDDRGSVQSGCGATDDSVILCLSRVHESFVYSFFGAIFFFQTPVVLEEIVNSLRGISGFSAIVPLVQFVARFFL